MSEFESTSLPRRQSRVCVCVISRFTTRQMSLTLTHLEFASTRRSDRRRRSRPGDRRGRAPASPRTKGSPARCRRIDARAGFDHRSRVHAFIRPESNSDRIGRVEHGADETALVSAIPRRTRSDPTKEDPTRWRLEEAENGNLRQRCVASTDRARTRRRRDESNERFDHRSCRVDLV